MQKTVLITGCSSGFGLDLTRALLQQNWRVLATARNLARSTELTAISHPALTILQLDVTRTEDINAITQYVRQELHGQLDCLINNAGFGLVGVFEELSAPHIREQLEVNLMGTIFLTQALLPFLRKTHGRLIVISSILGYLGLPVQSLYVTSKFAVEGLFESLYYELLPHQVQVSIVEPGVHRTAFGNNTKNPEKSDEISEYQAQRTGYDRSREQLTQQFSAPAQRVTDCIIKLLNRPHMPLRVRVGMDAKLVYAFKRALPEWAFVRLMRAIYKYKFSA